MLQYNITELQFKLIDLMTIVRECNLFDFKSLLNVLREISRCGPTLEYEYNHMTHVVSDRSVTDVIFHVAAISSHLLMNGIHW